MSESAQLAAVSLEAALLFTWCLPHLDCEGRMNGEPGVVRGKVVPLRPEFTEERVAACLWELAQARLVTWYWKAESRHLAFPGFADHQAGLRKDREAPSRVPPPTSSGVTPVELRSNSGSGPELVPPKVSEGKGSEGEVKGSSVLRTEAAPRLDSTPDPNGTPYAVLLPLLRETGYAPDGVPPADPEAPDRSDADRERRDAGCFKALLGRYAVDDIADALRGVRAVADRQLPLPEGDTAWLRPFEKFTARWLVNTWWGARPLLDVARDVWRKGKPRRDRGGPAEDVGAIVGRVA